MIELLNFAQMIISFFQFFTVSLKAKMA